MPKPPVKIIGLTATPYRMDTFYRRYGFGKYSIETVTTIKLINRLRQHFWNRVVFNVNNHELVEQGYLVPLTYIDRSIVDHAQLQLNKSKSDFDVPAWEEVMFTKQEVVLNAIDYAQRESKSVLVFCSSVEQAEKLSADYAGSAVVSAKTKKKERSRIINGFKDGSIQTVFNVGVLTTGFDHPGLDCIVLLRPTRSIGLYYQMVGRGVRLAPGKTTCKVIDITSTVKNMGEIESIKLEKVDGQWELNSSTGTWHNQELYKYQVERKQPTQPTLGVDNGWEKV